MWSSPTYYFSQETWYTTSEEIDLHVHGKKIYSFYAFELMMQFLAEEVFLNMHADIFEFNSWCLNSVEYWIFFIVECL